MNIHMHLYDLLDLTRGNIFSGRRLCGNSLAHHDEAMKNPSWD